MLPRNRIKAEKIEIRSFCSTNSARNLVSPSYSDTRRILIHLRAGARSQSRIGRLSAFPPRFQYLRRSSILRLCNASPLSQMRFSRFHSASVTRCLSSRRNHRLRLFSFRSCRWTGPAHPTVVGRSTSGRLEGSTERSRSAFDGRIELDRTGEKIISARYQNPHDDTATEDTEVGSGPLQEFAARFQHELSQIRVIGAETRLRPSPATRRPHHPRAR